VILPVDRYQATALPWSGQARSFCHVVCRGKRDVTVAATADDGLIHRNPCRIKGASAERSPERLYLPGARQRLDR
jgi:hypothetical protein